MALLSRNDSYEFDNGETNIEKMKLISFISFSCAIVILSRGRQLTLEGARGKLKLKNFFHLHRHRLKVHPFASLEVGKEMKCTASCLKSEECFSFNVKKLTANNFLCELLNTSKYLHNSLTNDESFSHYFLQDPCVPNPCVSGVCKDNKNGQFACRHCPANVIGKRCEICKDPGRNFALRKQTAQVSTYEGSYGMYSSNLAVDGNKGTRYIDNNNQPQCTHTATGYGDWWRVDFGETMLVSRVTFTNRGDCCWERMADFEIRVGDSSVNNGLENPKCGDRHNAGIGTTNITCTPPVAGRHLVIQTFATADMNICELEVYCE